MLVYLEDTVEGGETIFPELKWGGVKVRPKKGMALVWNNVDQDGQCIGESVHRAAPVGQNSRKSILQRWYYNSHFPTLGVRHQEPEVGRVQLAFCAETFHSLSLLCWLLPFFAAL